MKWLCGPYQEFTKEEREKLAKLAACGDPVQEALNNETLKSCGAILTVEPRPEEVGDKAPPWVVVNLQTGNLATFMGIGVEGGDTREEAFERAVRIGEKNDMSVVDLEADDE